MPYIHVKMLNGRSVDQKRALADAITKAMTEICGARPDGTMIIFEDVEQENWARGGILVADRDK